MRVSCHNIWTQGSGHKTLANGRHLSTEVETIPQMEFFWSFIFRLYILSSRLGSTFGNIKAREKIFNNPKFEWIISGRKKPIMNFLPDLITQWHWYSEFCSYLHKLHFLVNLQISQVLGIPLLTGRCNPHHSARPSGGFWK